jgi:hypothetical protein
MSTPEDANGPGAKLGPVRERIATAAKAAGRDNDSVQLIAVTKTYGSETIAPVIEAGQRDFGENRVQEALGKWPELRTAYPDLRLHLIGPLQTNKVRDAVALFDVVHSVDREKLAAALASEMGRQGRNLTCFVQVNTGEEPQKAGVKPDATVDAVRNWTRAFGLAIEGLMCIPPADEDPEPHFDLLRQLGRELELPFLSMGMSGDFEAAIAHGATHVRVGSAIFGARS